MENSAVGDIRQASRWPGHSRPARAGSGGSRADRSPGVQTSPGPWRSGRRVRALSLTLLLVGVGCLYLIGLSASGWANSFYSAAAQAGSVSWKALFFGSSDAANFITVDKPPAFMWVMGISVRLFGVNSWAILVPEALAGIGAVAMLYLTVRRVLSHGAGSLIGVGRPTAANGDPGPTGDARPNGDAGSDGLPRPGEKAVNRAHWAAICAAAIFATTPSATLMFRYNNPDALLMLLLVVAAYFTVRAIEKGSRGWLAAAGVAIGFAFLTKMLQAFLILPALGLAYLLTAPRSWGRRIADLATALGAMILSAGWYVAIFELAPTSWRPYMGGSQTNSFLELVFGYNGLGRLTGNETGSVVPGGTTGAGSWGQTGITRLFTTTSAGMVTWLIPAAVILSVTAIWLLGRRAWANLVVDREQPPVTTESTLTLAGIVVMLGSLVVTFLTFSYMSGIYHDYYTVALTPWIGGAVGLGGAVCWQHRQGWTGRIALAGSTAVSAGYAIYLLQLAGGSWMILAVLAGVLGAVGCLGLVLSGLLKEEPASARIALASLVVAVIAGLSGPLGYSINTAATPHSGAIVTAGPVSSSGMGGGPGGAARVQAGRSWGGPGGSWEGAGNGRTGGMPGGGPNGANGSQSGSGRQGPATGTAGSAMAGAEGGSPTPGGGAMAGGLNGATQVSAATTTLLSQDADSYTWVAAVTGSNSAASYQLATMHPVMAIGGYNGTDPAPTLAQFTQLVAQRRIHYYIASSTGGLSSTTGASSGSDAAAQIASWVASHFTARTVGSTTIYDLSQAAS